MRTIVVGREVDAAAPDVWRVVTDLGAADRVLTAVRSIERLDAGEGFGVGTRWRETRVMFGREATAEMEVVDVDPGRAYTVVSEDRGTRYRSTVTVDAIDDRRSRVEMTFGGEAAGTVGRILAATVGRLFAGSTRKALRQDLDEIAAAAERRAPA